MILNGWRLTDGKAFWMAETGEDPEGNTHTIAIVVQEETPERLLEQAGELDEGRESRVQIEDSREGLYLKLMLDGEGETIFDLGTTMPVTEFAAEVEPANLAWGAAQKALEHRQRQAVDERLREIAD